MSQISTLERLSSQLLEDPTRIKNPTFLAELEQAVQALRQQRASILAESSAGVQKVNRPVTSGNPESFAPCYLIIGEHRLMISKTVALDDLADRLAKCWNFCLGVPNSSLIVRGASSVLSTK